MSKEDNKEEDVKENSSTPSESGEGDKVETQENDKEKNFAKLRDSHKKDLEEKDNIIKNLQSKLNPNSERSLTENPNIDNETQKILFERDRNKAVRKFNKDNKVSDEEWEILRSKVSLKGTEDDEIIYDKIEESYNSLQSVKEKREAELIEQGRKEALSQFTDEEMDIGSGGEIDNKNKGKKPLNAKEKRFAKSMGLDEK